MTVFPAASRIRAVKVRVGYGIGSALAPDPRRFGELCTELERLGFDSLWLSERATAEGPDPLIGLAYAAGCTRKLKLGMSVLVVPGRNPALLAKELASLDRLSDGRRCQAYRLRDRAVCYRHSMTADEWREKAIKGGHATAERHERERDRRSGRVQPGPEERVRAEGE